MDKLKFDSIFKRLAVFFSGFAILFTIGYSLMLQMAYQSQYWWTTVIVGFLFIFVGVAFAYVLAQNTTKAIKQFVMALTAVENGEKCDPVKLKRFDEFKQLESSLNRLIDRDKALREANQDPLTGLANRRYLMQRLEKAMNQDVTLSIMFIDLDGFKPINDDFGHDVGDEALRIVSERLGACVRENDVLCRLGGDEFVIMFTALTDREVLEERANKVLEMINTTMWIQGNRVRMGASIGIAVAPKDSDSSEGVMNAADESMYAAKQGGKNAFRFYS